ncbi:HAMP domain-containing sensor histidine kinase [Paenibacillus polymyxa]|uniref:sensor histidine kinase n=1 Tax=Paenibacillus polymyxa TaxID=1406 RepID=UPI0025B68554|nr:HAMP domain-containing sensor histidine kinase [Paenibacillus polymyxa]MDN4080325.1 HAMP domain-containing sensor histidine kinase [Paenibacillus polymyxa]MDN4105245.1 HAMP domain-containing sensor histidine kinase [Paenibacillus polymyxa]MDN4115464.1 HAMP domain-containing sensor histidine kinase [Paenibacillus polymyxa]
MNELIQKPKRKKRIQVNILIRMVLSLIIALAINSLLVQLFKKISNVMEWHWFRNFFPYLLTPLFMVTFIFIFLVLTRRIVRDLITLEQGLQFISEGNLHYRVPVVRQDELGRVAHNINRMTERLEQQIVKEREIEKSKMELITGISHDLRTPLTSIIGYIELLRTDSYQDKDEYTRFVQNTYNKAIHLKKLLDDLFEYTRLTSVDTHLNLRRINLFQLLDQLLFEFEPIAQENGVYIVKDIGDSSIITSVDSDKMARAIDNLLMNALKYSLKPGGICIRLQATPEQITIEVENEGIPLTQDQKEKLFDRFYKVDHSRSSEGIQTGAGLGLSIARNIVELHQGTLTLDHTNNTFIFQLNLPTDRSSSS